VRPGFTGAPLDRADHLRTDEARLAELVAGAGGRMLVLNGLDPELDESGHARWEVLERGIAVEMIFLGLAEGAPHFAPIVDVEPGQRAWSVFTLLNRMAGEDAAVWGAARSLNEWHSRHLFCSACGVGTRPFRAGWGRRCTGCSAEHFPRVDPVVIMLAEHDGRVLLGRQPQYPPGRYSALAGFVEPGESIEEAVARELREEAGVEASDVRYVASQPWPFPGQLMIACLARVACAEIVLDRNELEDAIWVDRAGVASALAGEAGAPFLAPPAFAIAHTLLRHWVESGAARLAPSGAPA
jgi:NAD+ diphosphatase